MAGKDITLYEESTSTNLYPRTYTRNVFDEDGTTTLQTLLQNIKDEAGKIAEVQVNGTALTITDKTVNIDLASYLASYVPISRTVNGKALSANITLNYANVNALPNYSITINHQTAGNPRHVKFLTVNYSSYTSNAAAYFKLGAMSCHGNGTSYQFLEDIVIGVTSSAVIKCEVYKYVQIAGETVDGIQTYYGDVYYVHDSTNKIIDFYILCGQYASSQFTPFTKMGSTTTSGITQYSGTATYYSSGTRIWASGNGGTYARTTEVAMMVSLTQAEYDALSTKDPDIYYAIVED